MINNLVSIVIPTYQHAEALPACLDSVLAQTYDCLEILVIDDGSTDRTQEVLEKYRDRITSIRQSNQGANTARNRGMNEAQGEFLIFIDADLVLKPHMIETMYETLKTHPDCSFAYCAFRFGYKKFPGIPFDISKLRERNYIHTSSLVRRADFPGFDPAIRRLQDWDVWLTIIEAGKKGVMIPELLFTARIFGNSRIGSSWMPKYFYVFPWEKIGWQPMAITQYKDARDIIATKHHL